MSLLHIAGGATEDKLDASDVFSTYLYTGNGSTQTINNGIDLAGKGGMVWIKHRNDTTPYDHQLFRNDGTLYKYMASNSTSIEQGAGTRLTSYNNNGFSIGVSGQCNRNTINYASWTFRKAPKFFDIVTYTGNGVAGRQIPHNLGCEVGMIIVKCTNVAVSWAVYHRSTGVTKWLRLQTTDAALSEAKFHTEPTATQFYLSANGEVNEVGRTYVAYLFAHDPSADGIIQCGTFTGTNAIVSVELGWEPQFLIVRSATDIAGWGMFDTARGLPADVNKAVVLNAHSSAAEHGNGSPYITSTGFKHHADAAATYIYLAIRRPNKVPTSGSEVFAIDTRHSTTPNYVSNFPVDMAFVPYRLGGNTAIGNRLAGSKYMSTNLTSAETSDTDWSFAFNNGWRVNGSISTDNPSYMFKRAKGFFDVVCYTGTGVARTVNHNLGVVPEMMIVKVRNYGFGWQVYSKDIPITQALQLELNYAPVTKLAWNATTPTETTFSLGPSGDVNSNAATYVSYLFATLAGISKCGSYAGNGTSQTINCGFSTGSRFILIKRTDSTGDWYIWDTARGIVAANDPHLSLNTTAAEVTTDDSVDPEASGFIVNQNTATNINVLNGTYIFLAIA